MTNDVLIFLDRNPWCDMALLEAQFGQPAADLRFQLKDRALVERLNVAKRVAEDKRTWATRYALTAAGAYQVAGSYARPDYLLDALLMSYGRLDWARAQLGGLLGDGRRGWLISPWRPYHAGRYFDALCGLQTATGSVLLTYFRPPELAPLDHTLAAVARWTARRARLAGVTAVLLIDQSALGQLPERQRQISRLVTAADDLVVIRVGGDTLLDPRSEWVYVGKREISQRVARPPWELGGRGRADSLPAAADFLPDRVKTTRRQAQSLEVWLRQANTPKARLGRQFTALRENELQILEALCRFPTADPNTLEALSGKRTDVIRKCCQALAEQGLAQPLPGTAQHWLATDAGVALFAAWQGVHPADADQFMAQPTRTRSYANMLAHNRVVMQLGTRFKRAGLLASWSMDNSRQVFYGPGHRRVEIRPDSHFVLHSHDRRWNFWLEVDRGNRRGARLERTLEKYFRIRLATRTDIRDIPPLLYVVSMESPARETQHLNLVRKRLEALAQRYPTSRPFLLLTTGARLQAAERNLGDAPLWEVLQSGRFAAEARSLHAVVGGETG